jgi:hypothetical protein
MVQGINVIYAYVDQQGHCPYSIWSREIKK